MVLLSLDLVLKNLVREYRPFWVRTVDLQLAFCDNDFGVPDPANYIFFVLFIPSLNNWKVKLGIGEDLVLGDVVSDY